MAYYPRKRRKKEWVDWGYVRAREKEKISTLYGGIDDDVKFIIFNDISTSVLKRIFDEYKAVYGERKAEYAKKTYDKWKCNTTDMTGKVAERFLKIVPQYLSLDVKYDLISKLYRNTVDRNRYDLFFEWRDGPEKIINTIIDKVFDQHHINISISESVKNRLSWLSDNDAIVSMGLLNQVISKEREIAFDHLKAEIYTVFETTKRSWFTASVKKEVNLTMAAVYIEIF